MAQHITTMPAPATAFRGGRLRYTSARVRVPYLIDGNNLLGSWGGSRNDDGRAEVVRRVSAFCRTRGARALIVFDGPSLRPDLAAQALGSVSLRVPPPGQDADGVIRRVIDDSAQPAELIVVSSDKAVYSYARHRGATGMRAHEWNALARRPAPGSPVDDKPQVEHDVDGWLAVFSPDAPDDHGDKPR